MSTRINPWDVSAVTLDSYNRLHFEGINHYNNGPFRWALDCFGSMADFHSRRYTFHRATWAPGTREAFARMVKRNKRLAS